MSKVIVDQDIEDCKALLKMLAILLDLRQGEWEASSGASIQPVIDSLIGSIGGKETISYPSWAKLVKIEEGDQVFEGIALWQDGDNVLCWYHDLHPDWFNVSQIVELIDKKQ